MTVDQGVRRLEQFAGQLPQAAAKGLWEVMKVVRLRAVWWSSGPLSQATLTAMGHPYARRYGGSRPDPARINVQTGRLLNSWLISPAERRGDTLTASVYNTAPEARFLAGTTTMVERPLPERVLAEAERSNLWRRVETAVDDVLR